jgi:putative two-component system response regulator
MSTVLIVDDDPAGRQTLESVLDGQGYRLEFAENGVQALEKTGKLLPDVILLDIMMPGMTGFEVCERIRADKRLAEIPIIILTALDDHNSMLKALEAGADDFISKPFDRYELRARLMGITRLNRFQKLVKERTELERVNAELIAAYDATILGWSRAMDLRDRETEGHSQRVAESTLLIARAMGFNEQRIVHVRRGALLHDIGKLGIPDSILHKPGKLNSEEWAVMQQHPTLGYKML